MFQSGRRARKAGAQESHAKTASKLLNAQLREAALKHVVDKQKETAAAAQSSKGKGKRKDTAAGEREEWVDEVEEGQRVAKGLEQDLGENVVYLDDLLGVEDMRQVSSSPPRPSGRDSEGAQSPEKDESPDPSKEKGKKKKDFHKDPYALPPLEASLSTVGLRPSRKNARASSSMAGSSRGQPARADRADSASGGAASKIKAPAARAKKDVRYATEGELRNMMSNLKPEDLSTTSPFFASLPVALQYELVGDMRAQSRGTSYKRLMAMQAAAPTAADFSKQQVLGLKTRNDWTQRVLEVTDQIGSAHIKVETTTDKGRIAGSRGKEYVLVRNEKDGGFVLGLRHGEGQSKEKAIDIEKLENGEQDADMIPTDEEDEAMRWARSKRGTARDGARAQNDERKRLADHTTDEEDFEEVQLSAADPSSPIKSQVLPAELVQLLDENGDAFARKDEALKLLQQKARAHARQSRKDAGITSVEDVLDDEELLEEVARAVGGRQSTRRGRSDLFRQDGSGPADVIPLDNTDESAYGGDEEGDVVLMEDPLAPSAPGARSDEADSLEDFGADVYDAAHFGDEADDTLQDARGDDRRLDDDTFEEVDVPARSPAPTPVSRKPARLAQRGSPVKMALAKPKATDGKGPRPQEEEMDQPQGTHGGNSALGFRYQDRAGEPMGMKKSLFIRDEQRRRDFEDDYFGSSPTKSASERPSISPSKASPVKETSPIRRPSQARSQPSSQPPKGKEDVTRGKAMSSSQDQAIPSQLQVQAPKAAQTQEDEQDPRTREAEADDTGESAAVIASVPPKQSAAQEPTDDEVQEQEEDDVAFQEVVPAGFVDGQVNEAEGLAIVDARPRASPRGDADTEHIDYSMPSDPQDDGVLAKDFVEQVRQIGVPFLKIIAYLHDHRNSTRRMLVQRLVQHQTKRSNIDPLHTITSLLSLPTSARKTTNFTAAPPQPRHLSLPSSAPMVSPCQVSRSSTRRTKMTKIWKPSSNERHRA